MRAFDFMSGRRLKKGMILRADVGQSVLLECRKM